MDELTVRESVEVAASARTVWRVLTDPEQTRKYMFGCEAVTDWKVGSRLEWTATVDGKPVTYVTGVVKAHDPDRLLSYTTFGPGMGIPDLPENHVTVVCRLTAAGDRTRLEVSQGDYAKAPDGRKRYEETVAGWRDVLPRVKALAESLEG